jgi:hypothetical protein
MLELRFRRGGLGELSGGFLRRVVGLMVFRL